MDMPLVEVGMHLVRREADIALEDQVEDTALEDQEADIDQEVTTFISLRLIMIFSSILF